MKRKKMNKLNSVRTLEEYRALPKSERYFFGWYRIPFAMELSEWEDFYDEIQDLHPVQYHLREWTSDIIGWFSHHYSEIYWNIYRFFAPCHQSIRKAIPRQWQYLDAVMIDVNFAIIKEFRQEMLEGYVDWKSTPEHIEFEKWIIDAVDYIDNRRPALIAKSNDMPDGIFPLGEKAKAQCENLQEWEDWSKSIKDTEEEIDKLDTKVLTEMIQNRGYFWT